jgi:predicted nucleotidyltransferase
MDSQYILDNTIFLTRAGSHAYGTSTPESDEDYRGVAIVPDKAYYFGTGMKSFSQMDKGFQDDRVIYDIRKFVSLAVQNNPNIIELLFVDNRFVLQSSTYWEKLVENRQKFLSKACRYRFGGYAFAQLKRIKNHRGYLMNPPKKKPERTDFGLPERKLISSDHMGAFTWLIASFLKGSVEELNLSDTTKSELRNVNWIGLAQSKTDKLPVECYNSLKDLTGASDEFVDVMTREKAYVSALNNWNAYLDWQKRRNQSRKELEIKFGFDTKHAMHLVRLLRMAKEILETGKVTVYRPDREELLAIRNGAWTYEQIVDYAEQSECTLNKLYEDSCLPRKPKAAFIESLCCEIVEDYIYNRAIN